MTTRYNFGNPDDRGDDFAREPHDAYPVDEYPAAVPADLDGTDGADDAADYVEFEDVDDYRGAHRRDADEEYEDYGEYGEYADDDNTSVIPAAAGAAAGAAGTAAATRGKRGDGEVRGKERRKAKSSAGSSAVAAGGVPKRGLAMILIAVAALLLLWGIYAMTQNRGADNDAAPAATSTTTAATETVANTGAPGAGSGADAGASAGQTGTQNPNATAADGANPQDPNAPRADDPNAPAPAPAPAAGGNALTAANAEVFVFNNSGVPNAASDTAARLDPQFNVANNSPDPATMNMPEQQYGVFPETTVFFDPQVPGAEQVAADIAQRVGGVPRANNDLPQGATGLPEPAAGNRNAITVVLAG